MKIEKMSAVAELVSSVAIVITLIYLAIQTQQTTSALAANSRAALMQADIDIVAALGSDPELAFHISQLTPVDEYPPERLAQNLLILGGFVRVREYAWFQYQDGLLDERAWNGYLSTLLQQMRVAESMQMAWEVYTPMLDAQFVAYVNAQLAETD